MADSENSSGTGGIKGRFKPGQSGNPGGRPKGLNRLLREAREKAPDMLRVLYEIAINPGAKESARVQAATAILDRAYGKPKQQTEVSSPPGEALRLDAAVRAQVVFDDPDRISGILGVLARVGALPAGVGALAPGEAGGSAAVEVGAAPADGAAGGVPPAVVR